MNRLSRLAGEGRVPRPAARSEAVIGSWESKVASESCAEAVSTQQQILVQRLGPQILKKADRLSRIHLSYLSTGHAISDPMRVPSEQHLARHV